MEFLKKHLIEVKNGTKVTYSESDLSKLDRTYEMEVFNKKKKRIMTSFRREMQRGFISQVRDYAFERILDQHLYTFKHLLVVPNPYGIAKQTALILFNTSQECKVRYRVIGDMPEYDFWGETEVTTRHRVPIMGLYHGRNNYIELWLETEDGEILKHRTIRIYVSEISKALVDIVENLDKNTTQFPFILLNGVRFRPIAIDGMGKIRYSLQCRTGRLGMIPLQNGRFLLADRTANRMNEYGDTASCRYHEMDYMGRVYRTFLLDYPIGNALTQMGDSLFLVTASDSKHIADKIVELDMNSGKIISECDLREVLGEKYRTQRNWGVISYLEQYQEKLLLVVKNLHSVILLDWKTKKPDWILAPELVWKDTEVESYVLKSQENDIICSKPEYATICTGSESTDKKLLLFDTQNVGTVANGGKYRKRSAVRVVSISEEKESYQVEKDVRIDKILRYGSVVLSSDLGKILVLEGNLKWKEPNKRSQILEIDTETEQIQYTTAVSKVFSKAWLFQPEMKDYCNAITSTDEMVFGGLKAPEIFKGDLPKIAEEKVDREYFGGVKVCDNLFLFAMLPGMVDKIYFIGEKNAYVQDYTGIKEKKRKNIYAIPLDTFKKDEYHVCVEIEEEVFLLKNEIRVIKQA